MFQAVCPFCGQYQECLSSLLGRVITCHQCQEEFEATGIVPNQRGPVVAKLTSPHFCQHPRCRFPIEISIGRRECTIACPNCGCKTSIYAIIYHCPSCQTLLESPANLLTRTAPQPTYLRDDEATPSLRPRSETCPSCRRSVVVPFGVAAPRSRLPLEEAEFRFLCPSCQASLQAEKQHAGLRTACPSCLYIVMVPRYGEAQTHATTHAADPREAISRCAEYACPHCGNHIPVRSALCPVCSQKV